MSEETENNKAFSWVWIASIEESLRNDSEVFDFKFLNHLLKAKEHIKHEVLHAVGFHHEMNRSYQTLELITTFISYLIIFTDLIETFTSLSTSLDTNTWSTMREDSEKSN